MKNFYFGLFFYFLTSCTLVSGQQPMREEILALFKDTSNIQWIRDYQGRINDLEEIRISLGFDGYGCKGYLTYPNTETFIELAGNIKGSKLDLKELNEEGLITAYLKGIITPGMIEAEWQNYNRTIGSKFLLFTEKPQNKEEEKINKKWVKWYNGEVAHEKLRLILFHKSNNMLSGFCYNADGTKMYQVTGNINDDKSVYINFYRDNIEMARYNGKMKGSGLIKGFTTGIGVVNEPLQFELENEIILNEKSFQNFKSAAEILLPDSKDKDFDKYINDKIQPLADEIFNKMNEKVSSESYIPQPEERLVNRAYVYPDIKFVTKDLICGNILYSNTWEKNDRTIPFNYDVKQEREIQLEDIWNPKLSMQDTLSQYFAKAGKPEFSFKYFNITPQGLRFYDDIHPLYGRKEETIPYAVLRKWVRTKSPVRKLINIE